MLAPVIVLKSTNARWFELPTPAEAELSVPGFAFAKARSSLTELYGQGRMDHEEIAHRDDEADRRQIARDVVGEFGIERGAACKCRRAH